MKTQHRPYYKVNGPIITFHDHFDESLDTHNYIIRNCSVIIFSETASQSKYNQPTVIPKTIVEIKFGTKFNNELSISHTLQKLYMALCIRFDKQILLNKRLELLYLPFYFNKPIILTKCLVSVRTGHGFNQCINLPKKLLHLNVNKQFNQHVDLPKNLMEIHHGGIVHSSIRLNKYLKILIFSCDYFYLDCTFDVSNVKKLYFERTHCSITDNLSNGLTKVQVRFCHEKMGNEYMNMPCDLECKNTFFPYAFYYNKKKGVYDTDL